MNLIQEEYKELGVAKLTKIAFASDIHFDVNQLDYKKYLQDQIDFLNKQEVDFYFVAGDSFNDFQKSLQYFDEFNNLARNTKAYFIAGNHDMVRGANFLDLEAPQTEYYLHKKTLKILGTNYMVIGNNGWYDYIFAKTKLTLTDNEYLKFKNTFWIDGVIDAPISDPERYQLVLEQVEQSFKQVKEENQNEQLILLTHFLPKLDFVKFTENEKWNISTAMLGGIGLGKLIDHYHVSFVDFGHLHIRFPDQKINNTIYLHQPLGYCTKNRHEWISLDFMTEWQNTLKILEF